MAQHRCGYWIRQVLFESLPLDRRARKLRRVVLPALQPLLVGRWLVPSGIAGLYLAVTSCADPDLPSVKERSR